MKNSKYYFDNSLKISNSTIIEISKEFQKIIIIKDGKEIDTSPSRPIFGAYTKRIRYTKKLGLHRNVIYVRVWVSSKTRCERHDYRVERIIHSLKEHLTFEMINVMVINDKDKVIKASLSYNGLYYFGLRNLGVSSTLGINQYIDDKIYLKNNMLGYIGQELKEYYAMYPHTKSSIERIIKYRRILFISKKHEMNSIFNELITNIERVDFSRFRKSIFQKHFRIIKKFNLSIEQTKIYDHINKNNYKFLLDNNQFMKVNYLIDIKNIEDLIYNFLKEKAKLLSFEKTMNYILKNNVNTTLYVDYIKMLDELHKLSNSSQVLYPKEFKEKHDDAVRTLNMLKKQVEEKKAESVIKNSKVYEMQDEVYSVVLPNTLSDIILEGKNMDHCVGSNTYLEKHKDGTELVMFVRKSNDINTPLVTFSYNPKSKEITQRHAKGNMDHKLNEFEEITNFLDKKWLKYAKNQKFNKEKNNYDRTI